MLYAMFVGHEQMHFLVPLCGTNPNGYFLKDYSPMIQTHYSVYTSQLMLYAMFVGHEQMHFLVPLCGTNPDGYFLKDYSP